MANRAAAVAAPILREAYRREVLPARMRWWMAAAGLRDWYRFVAKEIGKACPEVDARELMAELVAETWRRRYADVRSQWTWLGPASDTSIALWAAGLYRVRPGVRGSWLWNGVGGAPTGLADLWRASRLVAPASADQRWREITVHLGEWLIVLTDVLPSRIKRANAILGDICFRAGVRYAEGVAAVMGIPRGGHRPEQAIEVLRMSEYLFRVNPVHHSSTEGDAGQITGSACPWHPRPGWERMHCGIFGQFQSGIASVFGLSYHLTKTIPKHGGDECRIDLKPIQIRARP